jgi:hypothetical protein
MNLAKNSAQIPANRAVSLTVLTATTVGRCFDMASTFVLRNAVRWVTVIVLLSLTTVALTISPAFASSPVQVDAYASGMVEGWGATAIGTLNHAGNTLVIVFVNTRDCCRTLQVDSVTVGDISAAPVQGSHIQMRPCKDGEMCAVEAWYAYLPNPGSDQVQVNWDQANLEWMGFVAVTFTNANATAPIESVSWNFAEDSRFITTHLPAGTPGRLVVQFAAFDQRLEVDMANGTANIQAGAGQTVVTDFTHYDTMAVAVGPGTSGAVTVMMQHTMLRDAFWETIALGVRPAGA